MSLYQAPLRDFQFVLHELLETSTVMQACGRSDFDAGTIDQVLAAAGEFAEGVIAPLNASGDEAGCELRDGVVTTPAGFRGAYRQYIDNGWSAIACSAEHGGSGFPTAVENAVNEIFGGANMAFSAYPGMSQATYVNVRANASEELKALYLPKMARGEWAGTMCLTEPQAGTDLGLLRTRAVPQPDGTYRITGSKIFISGGEHDLTENIVHLVLARLPDAPPGTKGISLFLVPKVIPNADGTLRERNAVVCGSIEHKMGIHANATCTMNFDGATGWLVGEANKGLAGMFVQMNHLRLGVGITAIGVMEAAWQKALRYANERVQGRAPGSTAPADLIVLHADVRRMLLTMKANVEGLRALALWASQLVDVSHAHPDADRRRDAESLVALLTPIVKAVGSDVALESTITAMQVFGGHGFIRESGVEQHVRDVRIVSLYEGTNGVQAMDLLGRKVIADGGIRMRAFVDQVMAHAETLHARPETQEFAGPVLQLARRVREISSELVALSVADQHAAGAASVPYLRLAGHLALSHVWLRTVEATRTKADSGDPFYASKLATARFYLKRLLPQTVALCEEIRAGAGVVMDEAALPSSS
ncbi:MAG: acyl-CoA dehydrogenase C-terminal domain-containing protein [Burkholderiales bacterium]|nr:acyl-CoA dehydrogenase C-terminal domain-containing protein [Burkholderiales bacterium]